MAPCRNAGSAAVTLTRSIRSGPVPVDVAIASAKAPIGMPAARLTLLPKAMPLSTNRRLMLMAGSSRLIRRDRRQAGQIFGYPDNGFVVDKRSWKGRHGVEAVADENFKIRLRQAAPGYRRAHADFGDRKSTRLNSSHVKISYAVFCLKKKTQRTNQV